MFENFGETIRDLRLKHHLTQEQLARKLNIDVSTVGHWERKARRIPDTRCLIELCSIFGVSLNDLLGIEQEQTLDIDCLTPRHQAILKSLVIDFQSNRSGSYILTDEQYVILESLLKELRKLDNPSNV